MERSVKTDITPVIDDFVGDVKPWFKQEHKADTLHQETVSPLQWKIARRAAELPDDENLHEVLVESSKKLNVKLVTLTTRRKVGLAFPNPHPDVYFGVYVELLEADAEHRDAIFAGLPEPVEPEKWTADKMRAAVRRFYTKKNGILNLTQKTVDIRGLGKVTFSIRGNTTEIILPGVFDVEVQKGNLFTTLKANPDEGEGLVGAAV